MARPGVVLLFASAAIGVGASPLPPADRIAEFLRAEIPVADGFDFPVGDADGRGPYVEKATGRSYPGWYVATRFAERHSLGIHPGEDWNGTGGSNTDLGQEVRAVAHGRVAFAAHCGRPWGNVVLIDHLFYENQERRTIRSAYVHLGTVRVTAGQTVRRRDVIGTVGRDPDGLYLAHLHLELRWDASLSPTYWPSSNGRDVAWVREHYAEPRTFVAARRRLPVPQAEAALLLVDSESRQMRLFLDGKEAGRYEVGFGQGEGRKRRQGDLRTPRGMYFVTSKSKGPFPGRFGAYYGGHWIKVNYPNAYDAEWGRGQGLLSAAQAAQIAEAWAARKPTWEGSALGGGIGFHGWKGDWDLAGPRRLSWGCVVMRNADIATLYGRVPEGAMVVIF